MSIFKKIEVPDNIMSIFNSFQEFTRIKDYASLKKLFSDDANVIRTYEATRVKENLDKSIEQLIEFQKKVIKFKSKHKIVDFISTNFDDRLIVRYHDITTDEKSKSELRYTEKITFDKNGIITELLYNYT